MRLILALTLTILTTVSAFSQTGKIHPRVAEIEKNLQSEIQGAVRDLLPGQSFHLKVTVDPLHRQTSSTNSRENLPFFEGSDEIKDEWDNPEKSDFELLARVNRISVKAFVPNTLAPEQVAEVKTVIRNRLPFVEGRDLIEVEQRAWPIPTDHSRYTSWILGLGLVLMLILGVVYFGVSSVAISRITKAIRNIKISAGESSSSGNAMSSLPPPPIAAAPTNSGFGSGHVQINDTIRMTEVILEILKNFDSSPGFPNLDHMVLFEQYFQSHPASVGGLLAEFPANLRNKIFSYSHSNSWLQGLSDPGDIDAVSFELMNKLVRIPRHEKTTEWNELLILCWRLGPQLANFLKTTDSGDSLAILRALPQSIAIQTARELMPGEWAAVLKTNGPVQVLSSEKIEKYKRMAVDFKPLRSTSSLEQYRRDTDLIKYLKVTDPAFEKEIYGAAPADSALKSLRPPFYPVLESKTEEIREFAPLVSIEDWALALLNIPKTVRNDLESTFSDKQKFRLMELTRRYDRYPVSLEVIGEARERIAKLYHDVYSRKQANTMSKSFEADPLREAA